MDRYSAEKTIGKGSFGKALLCRQRRDGKPCVIKQIDTVKLPLRERADAMREACVLADMNHPNIIKYWESFYMSNGHILCIVMDYAEGGDLYGFIKARKEAEKKYISEDRAMDWFIQISLALKHIHDRKILHRDLKTKNIFLTKENRIKVGDFGIAKVLDHTLDLARTAIGTPYYLSPEICQDKKYNHKSDMWSLGCVLYEMVCLDHAFHGSNLKELLNNICHNDPTPIPSRYHPEVAILIEELLCKDPSGRPSAHTVLSQLFLKDRAKKFSGESAVDEDFGHAAFYARNPTLGSNGGIKESIHDLNLPAPPLIHTRMASIKKQRDSISMSPVPKTSVHEKKKSHIEAMASHKEIEKIFVKSPTVPSSPHLKKSPVRVLGTNPPGDHLKINGVRSSHSSPMNMDARPSKIPKRQTFLHAPSNVNCPRQKSVKSEVSSRQSDDGSVKKSKGPSPKMNSVRDQIGTRPTIQEPSKATVLSKKSSEKSNCSSKMETVSSKTGSESRIVPHLRLNIEKPADSMVNLSECLLKIGAVTAQVGKLHTPMGHTNLRSSSNSGSYFEEITEKKLNALPSKVPVCSKDAAASPASSFRQKSTQDSSRNGSEDSSSNNPTHDKFVMLRRDHRKSRIGSKDPLLNSQNGNIEGKKSPDNKQRSYSFGSPHSESSSAKRQNGTKLSKSDTSSVEKSKIKGAMKGKFDDDQEHLKSIVAAQRLKTSPSPRVNYTKGRISSPKIFSAKMNGSRGTPNDPPPSAFGLEEGYKMETPKSTKYEEKFQHFNFSDLKMKYPDAGQGNSPIDLEKLMNDLSAMDEDKIEELVSDINASQNSLQHKDEPSLGLFEHIAELMADSDGERDSIFLNSTHGSSSKSEMEEDLVEETNHGLIMNDLKIVFASMNLSVVPDFSKSETFERRSNGHEAFEPQRGDFMSLDGSKDQLDFPEGAGSSQGNGSVLSDPEAGIDSVFEPCTTCLHGLDLVKTIKMNNEVLDDDDMTIMGMPVQCEVQKKLKLTRSNSIANRIEEIRIYLEERLGLPNFLRAYRFLKAMSEETWADPDIESEVGALIGGQKHVCDIPILKNLIAVEYRFEKM